MHDSSAQTKPDEQAEELEIVDDFDATFGTPRSRPWSIPGRSLHSARAATSRRILDESGMTDVARSHLAPIDPHDVPDGFLPTQVRGWLLLRNSRLGPQERAAILSATCGDRSYSKVSWRTEITME